jgi:hypothetical protein
MRRAVFQVISNVFESIDHALLIILGARNHVERFDCSYRVKIFPVFESPETSGKRQSLLKWKLNAF